MSSDLEHSFDTESFQKYISPDCDRLSFLREYLSRRGVSTSVIPLGEKKHIYVNFPSTSYNPMFKIKTIISHYDRVEGSPGANDNSFANFAIADFAAELFNSRKVHNIRIFFTDGEELGAEGVSSQGAFALADLFRKLGIVNDDVYVFDACGRGEVAVLARAGLDSKISGAFKKKFMDLYERTQNLLKKAFPNSWMTLPVPYSDNAGFLACGIPAVAITFLPKDEVSFYYNNLMADKNLEKAVMNCKIEGGSTSATDLSIQKFKYLEKMPKTWRLFHTEYDNYLSLTLNSIKLCKKILNSIAEEKILC
ncbi:M28 family peptidase [uncultured Treponema sp.]|uniref:M28 family peptidase n=1 Tax=uncultured Treponema sp. TaxID=162155 RepID=UPI0025E74409|nr:M28 family peptidase [uncultured Treponema sp.]